MSSYGSLSPPDEGFDRHEHYYCTPHAYHGASCAGAAEGAEGAWPPEGEHEPHDLFDTPHYIHRGYGYEEMQMSSESYDGYHPMHHIYPQSGAGLECEAQSTAPLRPYERATPPAFMRVVKRRNTANKKERRRTQSINTAFSDLRECIPNVPADTKLSKIKTLRLATSYISYLMRVLESDGEPAGGFCADLRHPAPRRRQHDATQSAPTSPEGKRAKGRTGWPQHVWALELNGDQGLQA